MKVNCFFFVASLLLVFLPYKFSTEYFEFISGPYFCVFLHKKVLVNEPTCDGQEKYTGQLCPLDVTNGSLNFSFQLIVIETNVTCWSILLCET